MMDKRTILFLHGFASSTRSTKAQYLGKKFAALSQVAYHAVDFNPTPRDFEYMTPYLGMRWSRMDYIHWVEDDRNRVKSDLNKSIGLIAGVDVPVHEKIWLNFEGQFLDAQAVAASIQFHF